MLSRRHRRDLDRRRADRVAAPAGQPGRPADDGHRIPRRRPRPVLGRGAAVHARLAPPQLAVPDGRAPVRRLSQRPADDALRTALRRGSATPPTCSPGCSLPCSGIPTPTGPTSPRTVPATSSWSTTTRLCPRRRTPWCSSSGSGCSSRSPCCSSGGSGRRGDRPVVRSPRSPSPPPLRVVLFSVATIVDTQPERRPPRSFWNGWPASRSARSPSPSSSVCCAPGCTAPRSPISSSPSRPAHADPGPRRDRPHPARRVARARLLAPGP